MEHTQKPNTLDFKTLDKIKGYIAKMLEREGSDLYIKSNAIVRARIHGKIETLIDEVITSEEGLLFAKELLRGRFNELVEKKNLDLIFSYNEHYHFRVNIFFQVDGVSAIFRTIPSNIFTPEELNLPQAVYDFTTMQRGLVLVTGITGSGKSTTLASLINIINKTQQKHIVTIEDPVEYMHKDEKCVIHQRNMGQDATSFPDALRAALREDPDIILVGEIRDLETMRMVIDAAETGHLVFATLHTLNAVETINRIVITFPNEEQSRVRIMLSTILAGVISQRLLPAIAGGRIPAVEIMKHTSRIEQLIATNQDHMILDAIKEGRSIYGSQSFDQHLFDLWRADMITTEDALDNATSASDIRLRMSGLDTDELSQQKAMRDNRSKEFMAMEDNEYFDIKSQRP